MNNLAGYALLRGVQGLIGFILSYLKKKIQGTVSGLEIVPFLVYKVLFIHHRRELPKKVIFFLFHKLLLWILDFWVLIFFPEIF